MMDFFQHQEVARKKTSFLVFCFVAAVGAIIFTVYVAVALILGLRTLDPIVFLLVAGGTVLIVFIGCIIKKSELSKGGSVVALSLNGELLSPNTRNPGERKLLNVVEEMSIAAGVPVPQVYVLRGEYGINAFAAGNSSADAIIGATEGCIRYLTRDELQGVIAHEFSHILNGDMKMNIHLMGWIYGIICLSIVGRTLMEFRSSSKRDKNPLPFIGLALLIIGSVGVFFARLIKSAVSRQREYLADASAVQFTRNPEGLTGALKKIGGLISGSKLQATGAEEASHLFFSNGLTESWITLFSTHPPLGERIHRLDPSFDGNFPECRAAVDTASDDDASYLSFGAVKGTRVPVTNMVKRVGAFTEKNIKYAATLQNAMLPELTNASKDAFEARALVYALLLSQDDQLRSIQSNVMSTEADRSATMRFFEVIKNLDGRLRLPLINLSLTGLRYMSANQYGEFKSTIEKLINADQQIEIFEYALNKIITQNLDTFFGIKPPKVIQYYSLRPLFSDAACLLSMLAMFGQKDSEKASEAFQEGVSYFEFPSDQFEFKPCDIRAFDSALNRISEASPAIQKKILFACARTVACDGCIEEVEGEVLRAIAETLGCPIPPFIEGITTV